MSRIIAKTNDDLDKVIKYLSPDKSELQENYIIQTAENSRILENINQHFGTIEGFVEELDKFNKFTETINSLYEKYSIPSSPEDLALLMEENSPNYLKFRDELIEIAKEKSEYTPTP